MENIKFHSNKIENFQELFVKNAMSRFSKEAEQQTENNFVSEEGIIAMDSFREVFGEDRINADKKVVADCEKLWSGVEDKITRESFIKNYGFEGESEESVTERLLARYKKKKETSNEIEIILTILIQKTLGLDYIVVRASVYDDYMNGVDTVIVNKNTGEVIAAFDELHNDERGQRAKEKEDKILKKMKKGGARLDYGFSFKEGKIVKESFQNLPIFYLGLSTTEMKDGLNVMDFDNFTVANEEERRITDKLKESLQKQSQLLLSVVTHSALKSNLERFRNNFSL